MEQIEIDVYEIATRNHELGGGMIASISFYQKIYGISAGEATDIVRRIVYERDCREIAKYV